MASVYSVAVSALNAAQYGMLTTQHNIANASTPGYSRQQTVQATNIPNYTGAGFIGQGVNVATVKRIFNEYLNTQVLQGQAQSSQLNAYYAQIQQVNNVIADPVAGLQPSLQHFFSAVNGVANAPGSQPARQAMLGSAQTLVGRFQSMNQLLSDMNSSVNGQIATSVTSINGYAQQIATLNHTIAMAVANGNGQPPNDLLDQRDQLVSQLNQEVKASVIKQSDGSYSVFIGNGQGLVVGEQAFSLQTVQSLNDPSKLDLGYTNPNGTVSRIQSSSLQGGSTGGLLAFRDQTLTQAQNALGRVAIGLASTFNDQHTLGQDLNGAMGGNFFSVAVPQVNTSSSNTGNAVVGASITSVSALTGSDYSMALTGGNYVVTRISDNTVVASTAVAPTPLAPLTVDGVAISISAGAMNAGDSFLIRPTVNGARDIATVIVDPSKIAAAVPVVSNAALTNTGSGLISAASVNTPPPPNVNLQQAVTITFNNPPTTFNVAGVGVGLPAVGVAYTSGSPITYNGWTMQISGSPNATDVFSVGPNTNGNLDGNNALLLAGLQTKATLANGTANYEGIYGQMVSQIGNKTNELKITGQAEANMVTQAVQQQQSVSGVNLDEEAANLMRYQQAYQAAGKAIQVANVMFDSILNVMK
jgi:flagellar hook-associated protein 1